MAEDASGNRDTLRFMITVEATVADPGFAAVEDVEVMEDAGWAFADIGAIIGGSPCVEHPLTFDLIAFDNQLIADYEVDYTAGNDAGQLKLLPASNAFGISQVIIQLTNEETGKTFTDTFHLNILPVNDPPYFIMPFSNLEMNPEDLLEFDLGAGYNTIFADVDDEVLQLSLKEPDGSDLPAWIQFIDNTLIAQPAVADSGCTTLMVTVTDAAGEKAESTFDLCVSPHTGIPQIARGDIRIYPNPTNGKVVVDLEKFHGKIEKWSVINMAGQEIIHRKYNGETRQMVDLSHLTSGVYILRLAGKDVEMHYKIVLKKNK